ncbi:unnamed protein product [Protopolystoma xenopodis]|uniref:Secreted protein n=1 Tax=Protopolystoma xenopodis TaxID=117903 RepID=A0A3S5BM39_9PLAT|nr:unnamed protein product [Protopolystoma xenopodis]
MLACLIACVCASIFAGVLDYRNTFLPAGPPATLTNRVKSHLFFRGSSCAGVCFGSEIAMRKFTLRPVGSFEGSTVGIIGSSGCGQLGARHRVSPSPSGNEDHLPPADARYNGQARLGDVNNSCVKASA